MTEDHRRTERLSYVLQLRLGETQRRYLEARAATESRAISEVAREAIDEAIANSAPAFLEQLEGSRDEFDSWLDRIDSLGMVDLAPDLGEPDEQS